MKRPLLTRETFLQLKRAETLLPWQRTRSLQFTFASKLPIPTETLAPVINIQMWNFLQNRQQNQPSITSNVTEFFNTGVSKTGVLPLSPLSLKSRSLYPSWPHLWPFSPNQGYRRPDRQWGSAPVIPAITGIRSVVWSNPQMPDHSGEPGIKMSSGAFHLFAHGNPRAPSTPLPFLPPWWAGQSCWNPAPFMWPAEAFRLLRITRKGSDYGQH